MNLMIKDVIFLLFAILLVLKIIFGEMIMTFPQFLGNVGAIIAVVISVNVWSVLPSGKWLLKKIL